MDEISAMVCDECGFTWHSKHGADCANCKIERLRAELADLHNALDVVAELPKNMQPWANAVIRSCAGGLK